MAKKYLVKDANDRFFTKEVHGFDLVLKAGVEVEVSAEVAKLIKKNVPYLEVK